MSIEELYQEVIIDHFKHPRCRGCLSAPDCQTLVKNPLCGDHVQLTLKFEKDLIKDIGYEGYGCSISQASASMMSELCRGKTLIQAKDLSQSFRAMMRGEVAPENLPQLSDSVALHGVRKFPARVKCAVLAWEALEKCIAAPIAGEQL